MAQHIPGLDGVILTLPEARSMIALWEQYGIDPATGKTRDFDGSFIWRVRPSDVIHAYHACICVGENVGVYGNRVNEVSRNLATWQARDFLAEEYTSWTQR